MTLTESDLVTAARELTNAETALIAVEPLSDRWQEMTIDDAYAIQRKNIEHRIRQGGRIIGHKIGFTSEAMQELLGVDEPDFGHIMDDMVLPSKAVIPLDRLLYPRIEAETAFLLRSDLTGPGVTEQDVVEATEYVVASLEVIDSRIVDWNIHITDTIADNASAARVVLGSRREPIGNLDLPSCHVSVSVDGSVQAVGYGHAALGNPVTCVAWLANMLGRYDVTLRAGHVVMPGSLHRALDVTQPCVVRADFDQLGEVEVTFQ